MKWWRDFYRFLDFTHGEERFMAFWIGVLVILLIFAYVVFPESTMGQPFKFGSSD